MTRAWPFLLLLGGCDFVLRLDEVEIPRVDANNADATVTVDAPAGSVCLGGGMLRVCFAEPPQGTLATLDTIDTTNDPRCQVVTQTNGPELCVVAYGSISINAPATATGSRPLVLVATDTITVGNVLDASSTTAGRTGPGARTTCTAMAGGTGPTTGGGGAGGSFGFAGGVGAPSSDAAGAASLLSPPPIAVVGGCAGGSGGSPGNAARASGGAGGGAVHLIAGTQIEVTMQGTITASGAGGRGGGANGGGGGGGAGGWIGLDAPTVLIAGAVYARGGGAGGGGGPASSGGDGISATGVIAGATGGIGGNGEAMGNNFGAPGCGGPNGTTGGNPAIPISVGGGGGGGGGCGIIRVRALTVQLAATSPATTQ